MNPGTQKKFNLLDIALFIVVLAFCFGGIIYLIKSAAAPSQTYLITLAVSDDAAENILQNEEIFLENGTSIGPVTAVRAFGSELSATPGKAVEVTFTTKDGHMPFKIGENVTFRTRKAMAEGTVYSISLKETS